MKGLHLFLFRCVLKGDNFAICFSVRLPIACLNSFPRTLCSAEPYALLGFSQVPVLRLQRGNLTFAVAAVLRGKKAQLGDCIGLLFFCRGLLERGAIPLHS